MRTLLDTLLVPRLSVLDSAANGCILVAILNADWLGVAFFLMLGVGLACARRTA